MNISHEYIVELMLVNNYAVIGCYVPIFLVAVVANVLVIWVVIKDQYMRNVTNYFLVNLSVADLMVALVCMPNAAYGAYTTLYYFGNWTCQITAYLQCVAVASSIFTITTMSIDRYIAINKPFGIFHRCFNRKTTILVVFTIWLLALILFMPIIIVNGTQKILTVLIDPISDDEGIYSCGEFYWDVLENLTDHQNDGFTVRKSLGIVWFLFMFVIPGAIMLFAYSMMSCTLCSVVPQFENPDALSSTQHQRNTLIRGRKRVACILLLLAFLFAVCWLPYHISNLIDDFRVPDPGNSKGSSSYKIYLLLLGHANSALNPIIYCALSRKFRRSIRDLIVTGVRVFCRPNRARDNMWWDSSLSGGTQQRLNYHHSNHQRLRTLPTVHNQLFTTTTNNNRRQSSQKTTKTCAV